MPTTRWLPMKVLSIVMVTLVTSCAALTSSLTGYKNKPGGYFHPYDTYERGFLADPYGYESRNTYQLPSTLTKSSSYGSSDGGIGLSEGRHKRRHDVTKGTADDQIYRGGVKDTNVDDLGVVYRKHVRDDYGQTIGSYSNGGRTQDDRYIGRRLNDPEYATRNAGLSRYNSINTGAGWVSAMTRKQGSSSARPARARVDVADRDEVEPFIGSGSVGTTSAVSISPYSNVRPVSHHRTAGSARSYVEPDQSQPTSGSGNVRAMSRPWYARRLESKQAAVFEEKTRRNPNENLIPRRVQPIVWITAYEDPCMQLPDGNYPLTSAFQAVFPFVDKHCNFVKCAHRSAFINPCGLGTRNQPMGEDGYLSDDSAPYCSLADTAGLCRRALHPEAGGVVSKFKFDAISSTLIDDAEESASVDEDLTI